MRRAYVAVLCRLVYKYLTLEAEILYVFQLARDNHAIAPSTAATSVVAISSVRRLTPAICLSVTLADDSTSHAIQFTII